MECLQSAGWLFSHAYSLCASVFPDVTASQNGQHHCEKEENHYHQGIRKWRKVYSSNGHLFQAKIFSRNAICAVCCDRVWGLGHLGYKCVKCNLLVHKKCHHRIQYNCGIDVAFQDDDDQIDRDLPLSSNIQSSDERCGLLSLQEKDDIEDGCLPTVQEEVNIINQRDLQLECVIGRGSYAKVFAVRHKQSQCLYALKVIKKSQLRREEDKHWVQTEKNVFQAAVGHPFLIALRSCFQSDTRLYFVTDFASGGDLMSLMQVNKTLPEEQARFYSAEIVLALEFLHEKGIIYRDLKLDNVLLDDEGHIKITDFGMCKEGLRMGKKTMTFCGTPNYIAPEMLKGEAYDHSVDWWSLGVLLYEMLAGKSPFDTGDYTNHTSNDKLYNIILERCIRIPRSLSVKASSILKGLLNKNPLERLGCMPQSSVNEIKSHSFYRDLNWEHLYNKQIAPPFKPLVFQDKEFACFDPQFACEPVSLTPEKQSPIKWITNENFEGFDYTDALLNSHEDSV